jgi:putative N6-adenine-specific DNA methylase
MSSDTSLAKRIKRHVIGRSRTYFAATAPGFEALCFDELKALGLPEESLSAIPGGVEFTGRLIDCYRANLHLRTANRILLRIHTFKATRFSQLEAKTAQIPWQLYLPPESSPQIHPTVKHCRLYHSDAIGQRLLKGISQHRINGPGRRAETEAVGFKPAIFVRGVDDRFTISVDSSGENLYKRGLKIHPGTAPLRETIAAAALLKAGYRGSGPVIDPMCGTGTFSLEAALMAKSIPPGWFREFAFMAWPSFQHKQWEYLKQQCRTHFTDLPVPAIFASDKNPAACQRLAKGLAENRLTDAVQVVSRDFFDFLPRDVTARSGLVALNPPYGRRLENRENSDRLFLKICARLQQQYQGWKLILIAPNRTLARKVPFRLTRQPISHGGLRPVMMIGTIK